MSCILISGGFGYIGSHTATILSEKDQKYVIVDNFSNCKRDIVDKIRKITQNKVCYYDSDIRDTRSLIKIINDNKVSSVIHFAALKSVSESIVNPFEYYEINVNGTISLLKAMQLTGVKKFIFSSSAAVYGEPDFCPIDENHTLKPLNPYAQTKITIENMSSLTSLNKAKAANLCNSGNVKTTCKNQSSKSACNRLDCCVWAKNKKGQTLCVEGSVRGPAINLAGQNRFEEYWYKKSQKKLL